MTLEEFSVVGIQYRMTKPLRQMMVEHFPFQVKLVREPDNTHDENAIAVVIWGKVPLTKMKMGYLRLQVAAVLAPKLDSGKVTVVKARLIELDVDNAEGTVKIWLKHKSN